MLMDLPLSLLCVTCNVLSLMPQKVCYAHAADAHESRHEDVDCVVIKQAKPALNMAASVGIFFALSTRARHEDLLEACVRPCSMAINVD